MLSLLLSRWLATFPAQTNRWSINLSFYKYCQGCQVRQKHPSPRFYSLFLKSLQACFFVGLEHAPSSIIRGLASSLSEELLYGKDVCYVEEEGSQTLTNSGLVMEKYRFRRI